MSRTQIVSVRDHRFTESGHQRGSGGHRDLVAWQRAMVLAVATYELTEHLPAHERFGLTSQMRRAAVSIPANIAEGNARFSRKSFAQFHRIARGSLAELETLLEVAERTRLLPGAACAREWELSEEVSRLLTGLSRSLAR